MKVGLLINLPFITFPDRLCLCAKNRFCSIGHIGFNLNYTGNYYLNVIMFIHIHTHRWICGTWSLWVNAQVSRYHVMVGIECSEREKNWSHIERKLWYLSYIYIYFYLDHVQGCITLVQHVTKMTREYEMKRMRAPVSRFNQNQVGCMFGFLSDLSDFESTSFRLITWIVFYYLSSECKLLLCLTLLLYVNLI